MSIFRLLKIALHFVIAPSENCYETHRKLGLFLYVLLLLLMLLWLAVHVWRMDAAATAAVAHSRSFATTPICTQSKKNVYVQKNTLIKHTERNKTVTHIFLHDDFVHTTLTHSHSFPLTFRLFASLFFLYIIRNFQYKSNFGVHFSFDIVVRALFYMLLIRKCSFFDMDFVFFVLVRIILICYLMAHTIST